MKNSFEFESDDTFRKIKTFDEYIIIYHTNFFKRIKNGNISSDDLEEIFHQKHIRFWEKFVEKFGLEMCTKNDSKKVGFIYYLIEDNIINRSIYPHMVDFFKIEADKMMKNINRLKFT